MPGEEGAFGKASPSSGPPLSVKLLLWHGWQVPVFGLRGVILSRDRERGDAVRRPLCLEEAGAAREHVGTAVVGHVVVRESCRAQGAIHEKGDPAVGCGTQGQERADTRTADTDGRRSRALVPCWIFLGWKANVSGWI